MSFLLLFKDVLASFESFLAAFQRHWRAAQKEESFSREKREQFALSGVLNRDLQQYSCDTPYSAMGTRR